MLAFCSHEFGGCSYEASGPFLYGTTFNNPALSVYSESAATFVEQIQQAGCGKAILYSLSFSPDRTTLYEAESAGGIAGSPNQIAILSTSNNQFIGAIPVPPDLYETHGLAISPTGATLYANFFSQTSGFGHIGFIDTASHTLTTTLVTSNAYGEDPLAVNSHTGLVYAAGSHFLAAPNTAQAIVDVIDPATHSVAKTFTLNGTTTETDSPAFNASGSTLYVHYGQQFAATPAVDEILGLDPSTGAILEKISPPSGGNGFGGTDPGIVITASNHLYVATGFRTLSVYDLNNHDALLASIAIPENLNQSGIALNAAQTTLYLSAGTHIYAISTATNAITGSFLVAPKYPQYIQNELAAQ